MRAVAEALPFFLEYFGLQVGFSRFGALRIEAQEQRDAEGRFRGADDPAGEDIWFSCCFAGGFWKIDVVRANSDVLRSRGGRLREVQPASPVERLDRAVGIRPCGGNIFAAC